MLTMLDRAWVLWRGQNLGSTGPAQVPAYSIAITVLCRVGRESCAECCNYKASLLFLPGSWDQDEERQEAKMGYTFCTAATSMG